MQMGYKFKGEDGIGNFPKVWWRGSLILWKTPNLLEVLFYNLRSLLNKDFTIKILVSLQGCQTEVREKKKKRKPRNSLRHKPPPKTAEKIAAEKLGETSKLILENLFILRLKFLFKIFFFFLSHLATFIFSIFVQISLQQLYI